MRIKVFFSLSLSTWYQSQGRKLYSFWFTRVINFGNPSSDHVSFQSPFPSPKVFRLAISWSENPHHRQHFSGDFFPVVIFDTDHIIRSAKRRFATFLKAPKPKNHPRASHMPLFSDGLNPTRRCVAHFPMPSFFQQARPTPSCTSKPLSVLSEPCFSIFFGISASAGLLSSSDGSSLPWPRLVCALGSPLLHPQSLFSFVWVPTYQVLLPPL